MACVGLCVCIRCWVASIWNNSIWLEFPPREIHAEHAMASLTIWIFKISLLHQNTVFPKTQSAFVCEFIRLACCSNFNVPFLDPEEGRITQETEMRTRIFLYHFVWLDFPTELFRYTLSYVWCKFVYGWNNVLNICTLALSSLFSRLVCWLSEKIRLNPLQL